MRNLKYVLLVIFCLVSLYSFADNKVDGTRGKVIEVLNGNTIRLDSGLKVLLYGVDDNVNGKKFLEAKVKGREVILIADSKDPRKTFRSLQTTVKAYVKIKGQPGCINRRMLSNRMANLYIGSMRDSLISFKNLVKSADRPRLTNQELVLKLKAAAFCITTQTGMGTGFFIGDDGLALTNNHVLNESDIAEIYMFGEDGQLDQYNPRRVSRIIATYGGQHIDFTIFRVELKTGERTEYLPIAAEYVTEGDHLAKIGCPLGEIANFQTGLLSNYKHDEDGDYLLHSIPTNNGDSGGPVVNDKGEVVGINQSIRLNPGLSSDDAFVPGQGLSFAVDVIQIGKWLKRNGIPYGK